MDEPTADTAPVGLWSKQDTSQGQQARMARPDTGPSNALLRVSGAAFSCAVPAFAASAPEKLNAQDNKPAFRQKPSMERSPL
jgi:hypothetical protein